MSKQASLIEYGVATITFTQQTSPSRDLNPAQLTVVILKLNEPVYGRCSLCNRWATLPFCLEYLNSQGTMVKWGEICRNCKEQSQGV